MSTAAFTNYSGGTFLSDLITVPNFTQYLSEAIYEKSAFIQSGAVARDARLDATSGGVRVVVPAFNPIAPTEEVITSASNWGTSGAGYLTPQKVTADQGVMTILHRGFSYAVDDISKLGSGTDPMSAILGYLAGAINKKRTATLVSQLTGIFATALSANMVDVSAGSDGSQYISAASVIKAKAVLGERGDELTSIAVHPNVYYYMQQVGMLTFSTSSLVSGGAVTWGGGGVGVTDASVATFAGLRVVVDSLLPTSGSGSSTVYTSYLFGNGVVKEGQQAAMSLAADRNILSMQDVMAVSYHYGFHVQGTSWSANTDNPTNSVLATSTNWALNYDPKLIALAGLKTKSPFS
jgi:hypothetical protein